MFVMEFLYVQVFCDNYLDGGYCVPYAHTGLASGLKLDSYSTTVYEKVSLQICESGSAEDDSNLDRLGSKALHAFVYPNFMINRWKISPCVKVFRKVLNHRHTALAENRRMSNSTRCAACKSLRRRCSQDCVLAPYFPSSDPQRFACVHKTFGASNISRMLQRLQEHERATAADCMSFEAAKRVQDPVYGCVAMISQLQQQIMMAERELTKTKCEIAYFTAQQAQQQQQQIVQITGTQIQQDELSGLNANQSLQDLLFLDQQQPLLDFYNLNNQM